MKNKFDIESIDPDFFLFRLSLESVYSTIALMIFSFVLFGFK